MAAPARRGRGGAPSRREPLGDPWCSQRPAPVHRSPLDWNDSDDPDPVKERRSTRRRTDRPAHDTRPTSGSTAPGPASAGSGACGLPCSSAQVAEIAGANLLGPISVKSAFGCLRHFAASDRTHGRSLPLLFPSRENHVQLIIRVRSAQAFSRAPRHRCAVAPAGRRPPRRPGARRQARFRVRDVRLGAGRYVAPAAEPSATRYNGGNPRDDATKARPGRPFNAHSSDARAYTDHLRPSEPPRIATAVGARPVVSPMLASNGFSADLTTEQAMRPEGRPPCPPGPEGHAGPRRHLEHPEFWA